jgi:molybdate-binding protein
VAEVVGEAPGQGRRVTAGPLERTDRAILIPGSGEVVSLDDSTDTLAGHRLWLKEMAEAMRAAARTIDDEILRRGDAEVTWTYRGGGLLVTMDGPGRKVYDAEPLRGELLALVARGVGITADAVDKAIKVETTYTAQANGIKALRKLGGEVADAIARHESDNPRPRQVRVARVGERRDTIVREVP